MPYFLKGNCVWSGTKEEPGKEIKCHESKNEATAHMRALYANVDDGASGDATEKLFVDVEGEWFEFVRDKGGTGSGWHRPPHGTHTAENAPNFRGGPGADRTYGTESDEPPEGSKLCKCTKCNSTFTLPKGKQCEDVKCPGCGGGATQTSPRKDPKAEGRSGKKATVEVDCPACEEEKAAKAMDAPGPQVHGEGASLGGAGVALDEDEKREMKSEGDGKHPSGHYLVVEDPEKPSTWHLRVRNVRGELDHTLMGAAWAALHGGYRGNRYEGPNKEMALAKLKRFYKQEGMDTPGEKAFTIYKSADGHWRWMSISSWAVVDKEREVVSEQAYRDAIAYAEKTGDYGQLDLVHVDGTDAGDADMLFILKSGHEPAKFGAGGTWYDTAKATRARTVIQAEPEDWGMSLKFRFNPDRLVKGVYTGDIQVLKHSILPQEMAASYGTAIAVQQGGNMSKQLDEKAAEALLKLGHTEEEIAELAEKQKALPQEENVAEKEDTATQEEKAGLVETLWRSLGKAAGFMEVAPDASPPDEARKADEVAEPAQDAEPAEETKQAEGDEPENEPQPDMGAAAKALAENLAPIIQGQLEERDKRIADLEALVKALGTDIETKVQERLADLPPVATVAPSAVATSPLAASVLGMPQTTQQTQTKQLLADIMQATEDTMGPRGVTV